MASTSLEIQLTVNLWTQDDGYMKGQLTFFCQPYTPLVNSPALVLSVTSYITRSYPNTQDVKIKYSGETSISYPMYNDGLVSYIFMTALKGNISEKFDPNMS